MIGGYDLIYESSVEPSATQWIMIVILKSIWPQCVVENDDLTYAIFVYKDKTCPALCEKHGIDPEKGTANISVHILLGPHGTSQMTLVVDSKDHPDMRALIDAVNSFEIEGRKVFSENARS